MAYFSKPLMSQPYIQNNPLLGVISANNHNQTNIQHLRMVDDMIIRYERPMPPIYAICITDPKTYAFDTMTSEKIEICFNKDGHADLYHAILKENSFVLCYENQIHHFLLNQCVEFTNSVQLVGLLKTKYDHGYGVEQNNESYLFTLNTIL